MCGDWRTAPTLPSRESSGRGEVGERGGVVGGERRLKKGTHIGVPLQPYRERGTTGWFEGECGT
jgi:hypothetical protein